MDLENFVDKLTTVPGTTDNVGAELLSFYLMLLAGVAASVLDRDGLVEQLKSDPAMLHLLIFLVIISKAITFARYDNDAVKTVIAAITVYAWFMMSVKLDASSVMTMLMLLLAGQVLYRVRNSPGLIEDETTRSTVEKIEMVSYGGAMIYTAVKYGLKVSNSPNIVNTVINTFVPITGMKKVAFGIDR